MNRKSNERLCSSSLMILQVSLHLIFIYIIQQFSFLLIHQYIKHQISKLKGNHTRDEYNRLESITWLFKALSIARDNEYCHLLPLNALMFYLRPLDLSETWQMIQTSCLFYRLCKIDTQPSSLGTFPTPSKVRALSESTRLSASVPGSRR